MKAPLSRFLCLGLLPIVVQADPLAGLLEAYRQAGAGPFLVDAGRGAWSRAVTPRGADRPRHCADCHGTDLTRKGSHIRTGKPIKPLAPSARRDRLSDPRKVEKWLRRNCRWTWGRECSPQEKGDLISYIASQ
jgi:hypothetical protein